MVRVRGVTTEGSAAERPAPGLSGATRTRTTASESINVTRPVSSTVSRISSPTSLVALDSDRRGDETKLSLACQLHIYGVKDVFGHSSKSIWPQY